MAADTALRGITQLGLALAFLYAVFLGLAWFAQRKVLFPRPPAPAIDVSQSIPGLRKLHEHSELPAEAWLLPPIPPAPRYPVLLFAHGNGELIDYWALEFETVRQWGMGVALVEYPGYGRSPGSPSQESITQAFVDVYDALTGRLGLPAESVVGYGRSLGGGAICQLAARRKPAALILESTFTSVPPLAARFGLPGWLVRDPFDNLTALSRFEGPVLLIHGTDDTVIPFAHSQQLHRRLPQSGLHPLSCGHNDCPRPWDAIRAFLQAAKVLDR